jgi:hypothetical protein
MLMMEMSVRRTMLGLVAFAMLHAGTSMAADEPRTYRDFLDYCAGRNVAVLDDKTTPADAVARALYAYCRQQRQDLYLGFAATHSAAYVRGYERSALDQFTLYVLSHRANTR